MRCWYHKPSTICGSASLFSNQKLVSCFHCLMLLRWESQARALSQPSLDCRIRLTGGTQAPARACPVTTMCVHHSRPHHALCRSSHSDSFSVECLKHSLVAGRRCAAVVRPVHNIRIYARTVSGYFGSLYRHGEVIRCREYAEPLKSLPAAGPGCRQDAQGQWLE